MSNIERELEERNEQLRKELLAIEEREERWKKACERATKRINWDISKILVENATKDMDEEFDKQFIHTVIESVCDKLP